MATDQKQKNIFISSMDGYPLGNKDFDAEKNICYVNSKWESKQSDSWKVLLLCWQVGIDTDMMNKSHDFDNFLYPLSLSDYYNNLAACIYIYYIHI